MKQKRPNQNSKNDKRIIAAKEAKSPIPAPASFDPGQEDGIIMTTAECIDFAQGADSR